MLTLPSHRQMLIQSLATARTLGLGFLGGLVMLFVGFPAAFLTGPALIIAFLSCRGMTFEVPMLFRYLAFCLLGTALGAGVNEDSLEQIGQWPVSLTFLTIGIVINFYLASFVMRQIFGCDRATADLSSVPGHLSLVVAMSLERNTDAKMITMIQSFRILSLTLLVPGAALILGLPTDAQPQGDAMSYGEIAILVLLGFGAGLIMKRLGGPAPMLVGPMIVSTIFHLGGFIPGRMPMEVVDAAILVIGCLAGSRFTRLTLRELATYGKAAAMIITIAVGCTIATSLATFFATDIPFLASLVAFSPGGLEAMIAMGTAVGADPAYVASHHLYRLFLLTAMIAFLIKTDPKPQS